MLLPICFPILVLPSWLMRLTKENVGKIALPEGKAEVILFDDALPGFGLRAQPKKS